MILPGATVGVLGGGQLGRMLGLVARYMGYSVHTLAPKPGSPLGQIADREVVAEYDDLNAVADFARGVDVTTFEFENVPYAAAEMAYEAGSGPVRPKGEVLHVAQHRRREKMFLADNGFPTADHAHIENREDLLVALDRLGRPAVLKTAGFGYDGKGQAVIDSETDADAAWASIGQGEAVLEAMVDFECEVSVVGARGVDGKFTHFGVTENRHRNHILDVCIPDAELEPEIIKRAEEITRGVLEVLDVVGVLCVEFFVTRDGGLLVNELAPRPHNSGHFSIDACPASQFELQLRTICGLPMGDTRRLVPSAMVNLLGDCWQAGTPDWPRALADPETRLHLYGKAEPRPGRKMGHVTALGASRESAADKALTARARLLGE